MSVPRPGATCADELAVQIEAGAGEPERLLIITRPGTAGVPAGRARVREWTGADWSTGPVERELDAADLYAELERAQQARRRISGAELYGIHLWLLGGR